MYKLSVRHITTLLLGLAILFFASCNRDKDASKKKQDESSARAITASDEDPITAPLQMIDTSRYYYGMVDDNSYYFKITALDDNSISGHYYPVGQSAWLDAVPFSIVYSKKKYLFQANGTEKSIKFKVVLDADSLSGEFSAGK